MRLPARRLGGSGVPTVTSHRHAARVALQNLSDPIPAESARCGCDLLDVKGCLQMRPFCALGLGAAASRAGTVLLGGFGGLVSAIGITRPCQAVARRAL